MQEALVYLIVLCALIVSFRRYAPKSWQRALKSAVRRVALKLGLPVAVEEETPSGSVTRVSLADMKRTMPKRDHKRP